MYIIEALDKDSRARPGTFGQKIVRLETVGGAARRAKRGIWPIWAAYLQIWYCSCEDCRYDRKAWKPVRVLSAARGEFTPSQPDYKE